MHSAQFAPESLTQSSHGESHFKSTINKVVALFLSMLLPATVFVNTSKESVGTTRGTMNVPIGIQIVVSDPIFEVAVNVTWNPELVHVENPVGAVIAHPADVLNVNDKLLGIVIINYPPDGIGFVFKNFSSYMV